MEPQWRRNWEKREKKNTGSASAHPSRLHLGSADRFPHFALRSSRYEKPETHPFGLLVYSSWSQNSPRTPGFNYNMQKREAVAVMTSWPTPEVSLWGLAEARQIGISEESLWQLCLDGQDGREVHKYGQCPVSTSELFERIVV